MLQTLRKIFISLYGAFLLSSGHACASEPTAPYKQIGDSIVAGLIKPCEIETAVLKLDDHAELLKLQNYLAERGHGHIDYIRTAHTIGGPDRWDRLGMPYRDVPTQVSYRRPGEKCVQIGHKGRTLLPCNCVENERGHAILAENERMQDERAARFGTIRIWPVAERQPRDGSLWCLDRQPFY